MHEQKLSQSLIQSQLSAPLPAPHLFLPADGLPQFVRPVLEVSLGNLPAPTLVQIESANIDLESDGSKSINDLESNGSKSTIDLESNGSKSINVATDDDMAAPALDLTDSNHTAATALSQSCLSPVSPDIHPTSIFISNSTSQSRNKY